MRECTERNESTRRESVGKSIEVVVEGLMDGGCSICWKPNTEHSGARKREQEEGLGLVGGV